MLDKLRLKWSAMTVRDKVKACVGVISDVGTFFIGNSLAAFAYGDDCGKVKKFTINVGAFGLSAAMAEKAREYTGMLVDSIFDSYEQGAAKAKKESEHA